jgi:hypothetical protein
MILIVNDKVVKQIVKKWPKGVSRCAATVHIGGGTSIDPNPARTSRKALRRESEKEEHESLIK